MNHKFLLYQNLHLSSTISFCPVSVRLLLNSIWVIDSIRLSLQTYSSHGCQPHHNPDRLPVSSPSVFTIILLHSIKDAHTVTKRCFKSLSSHSTESTYFKKGRRKMFILTQAEQLHREHVATTFFVILIIPKPFQIATLFAFVASNSPCKYHCRIF